MKIIHTMDRRTEWKDGRTFIKIWYMCVLIVKMYKLHPIWHKMQNVKEIRINERTDVRTMGNDRNDRCVYNFVLFYLMKIQDKLNKL